MKNKKLAVYVYIALIAAAFIALSAGILFLPQRFAEIMVFPAALVVMWAFKGIERRYEECRASSLEGKWQPAARKPHENARICVVDNRGVFYGAGRFSYTCGGKVDFSDGTAVIWKDVAVWIYTEHLVPEIRKEGAK